MSNNKTSDFNRRDFLKTGFLVTGSMVLGATAAPVKAAASSRISGRVLSDPPVSEGQRILGSGKAALKVSEVGFGCMGLNHHRGEHTRFDPQNDNRQTLPRFTPQAIRHNLRLVEKLNAFGRTRGSTPAQIALGWLMAQNDRIVPIPGTTKLSHLEENLRAPEFKLSLAEIEELNQAAADIKIMGDRYDAVQSALVGK